VRIVKVRKQQTRKDETPGKHSDEVLQCHMHETRPGILIRLALTWRESVNPCSTDILLDSVAAPTAQPPFSPGQRPGAGVWTFCRLDFTANFTAIFACVYQRQWGRI
jgi:hypothetical protein